jgi:hypothetical protein
MNIRKVMQDQASNARPRHLIHVLKTSLKKYYCTFFIIKFNNNYL